MSPVILPIPFDEGTVDATIRIDNEGGSELPFRVYEADFDQDRLGEHRFLPPGALDRSCADRLSFAPDALRVPAGASAFVRVRLEPGPGETCWSMLFVEAPSSAVGGIRVNQRVGVKIYGLGPERGADGELANAEARPVGDAVEVRLVVRNPGNWPLRPTGVVEIREPTGMRLASLDMGAFSLLPGAERDVRVAVPVDALARGRYLAVPILDLGLDHLAGAQVAFRLID